jgi:hypothetical protein
MNLTCSYCQTPFTLGMAEKVAALQRMQAENMHHYDAHCPRCGRANAVSRERLEMFTPGWKEAIKETTSEPAPVSSTEPMAPEPIPSAPIVSMPAKAPAKPAAKKPATKKPATKKAAQKVVKAKAKPEKAVKKTAAKKSKRKK